MRRPGTPNEYAELKARIRNAGLLESSHGYYARKAGITAGLIAAVVAGLLMVESLGIRIALAAALGILSTQVGLLAHDVVHGQVIRRRRWRGIAALTVGNVVLGLSHRWWREKHNKHHANPNDAHADPDINFPILVFAPEQAIGRPPWMRRLAGWQGVYFWLVLPFQGFWVLLRSAIFVSTELQGGERRLETVAVAVHWAFHGALLYALGWEAALAVFVVHMATFGLYNSLIFAPNHKGMPQDQDPTDFLRAQATTARNVKGSPLTDLAYGGLNYQIEHHLFPTMPRNRLKRSQPLVRAFCAERGVPYYETGVARSFREIASFLHTTGREAARLGAAPAGTPARAVSQAPQPLRRPATGE